ncbi:MAG TPA: endonuclease V [Pseudothermotoga sp.]|uniref:endonuclease V n=1 Tax=Thermotoga profunda TaxID=1508420 RepID=UPI00059737DB|nr:endonuclease V [Thermotoga profunda]
MRQLHSWDLTPQQAKEQQLKLRQLLKQVPLENIDLVAGVDLSFPKFDQGYAVIVVIDVKTMKTIECVTESSPVSFPYIPGLLAFREGPVFLKAWEKLKSKPDVIMFDGQGIAHPRHMGIAAHMGLFLELPTIGVAKSHLYGKYQEPGNKKGDYEYLYDDSGEIIGAVLRTKNDSKPLFVSPGHMSDLKSSIDLVLKCCTSYRLPEPTRIAHIVSQRWKSKSDKLSF